MNKIATAADDWAGDEDEQQSQASRKLSVTVESFSPRRSGALAGFCTIVIPELHLRIHDVSIFDKNGARWVGMPARPQIGRDGVARKDSSGKLMYAPTMEFTDAKTRGAFSEKVVASLLVFAPTAFATDEEDV